MKDSVTKFIDTSLLIGTFTALLYYSTYLFLQIQYSKTNIPEYLINVDLKSILYYVTNLPLFFSLIGATALIAWFEYHFLALRTFLSFLFLLNLQILLLGIILLNRFGITYDYIFSLSILGPLTFLSFILPNTKFRFFFISKFIKWQTLYNAMYLDVILFIVCVGVYRLILTSYFTNIVIDDKAYYYKGKTEIVLIAGKDGDVIFGNKIDHNGYPTDTISLVKINSETPTHIVNVVRNF